MSPERLDLVNLDVRSPMPSRESDIGMTYFRDLEQHFKPWPFLFYLIQVVTGEYYLQVVSSLLDVWRPSRQTRESLSYDFVQLFRDSDGTRRPTPEEVVKCLREDATGRHTQEGVDERTEGSNADGES